MYAGDEAEKTAEKLLQRRLSGEPLAYIAGKWEFFGLEMIVTPAVLIPRMDTEPLVFTALEILKDVPEPRILDLCCGSGCIGCALGVNLPKARVNFCRYKSRGAFRYTQEHLPAPAQSARRCARGGRSRPAPASDAEF